MSVHKNMLILRVAPETNTDTFTQRHTCMEAAVSGTKKLPLLPFSKGRINPYTISVVPMTVSILDSSQSTVRIISCIK